MKNNLYQLINEFLEYLEIEKNSSSLTIRNYRHYLYRFLYFLSSSQTPLKDLEKIDITKINLHPDDISLEVIRQYRLFLSRFIDEHNMSLKRITQNYHVIALRSFLRYLAKRDIKAISPEKIDLPKAESHSLKFLERDDIERLLGQPSLADEAGYRDKAIMEMLFSTGLRVSELVKLNRESINLERGEFGVIGKGGRSRIVFLSTRAIDWIKRYLNRRNDHYKPLFIRYGGPKPQISDDETLRLTARSVQRIVEKYVKKAKLAVKISPHGLRHSFATDLLRGGADLRSVQEMLGHKNITTTQIYTHITNPQLRQTHKKFHWKNTDQ